MQENRRVKYAVAMAFVSLLFPPVAVPAVILGLSVNRIDSLRRWGAGAAALGGLLCLVWFFRLMPRPMNDPNGLTSRSSRVEPSPVSDAAGVNEAEKNQCVAAAKYFREMGEGSGKSVSVSVLAYGNLMVGEHDMDRTIAACERALMPEEATLLRRYKTVAAAQVLVPEWLTKLVKIKEDPNSISSTSSDREKNGDRSYEYDNFSSPITDVHLQFWGGDARAWILSFKSSEDVSARLGTMTKLCQKGIQAWFEVEDGPLGPVFASITDDKRSYLVLTEHASKTDFEREAKRYGTAVRPVREALCR